ncbi:MAG: class I SAM-dependent methyltransferase [Bdellovibrionota bacterium]|nr:class I SAM-dependent methyltransferase [Bdellovibrionota bacterium]
MSKRVELHPASIKHLKKGHPWVTKDRFSSNFPQKDSFLWAKTAEHGRAILINDPSHQMIKARLWSLIHQNDSFNENIFKRELKERLEKSYNFRKSLNLDRDNYFLCFGEADQLPGLFIQVLGTRALIQFYSDFWNRYEKEVSDFVLNYFKKNDIWLQKRNKNQQKEFYCLNRKNKDDEFHITEFGIKYKIKLNKSYDIGLYTDMAAIRNRLKKNFENKRVLNLYSYTGAYSAFALKNGATDVTSIDLSKKYISWLEENLKENDLMSSHESIVSAVLPALKKLKADNEKFDLIICDPPSSSSDGKKRTKAIDSYRELIPLFYDLLNSRGEVYAFLNTHSITRNKFETKIKEYTKDSPFSISGHLKLTEDCPSLKGFPEGDYLKGLKLLKK